MNELQIFEGQEVEAFELNGQILFNPYHVGNCLELEKSSVRNYLARMNDKQAIKLKNSDVRDMDIRKLNNAGEKFLTESGLYKLAFKSHKANAEKFTDWIADEVLPTIRKTGSYTYKQTTAQSMQVPKISNRRKELQSKVEQIAERQNLKPKQVIRKIMLELGECHNLEVAKRQYRKQYGFNPPYAMDLIEAFTVLQAKAEEIADFMLKEPTAWEKMNAETEKVFANW